MAGKKDILDLVEQVEAYAKTHPQWRVRRNDNGQFEIKPPPPWGPMFITAASGRITAWKNLRAQLKRAGFPLDEEFDPQKMKRAADNLAADREKNDKALEAAEQRIQDTIKDTNPEPQTPTPTPTPAVMVRPVPKPTAPPVVINPFQPPHIKTPEVSVPENSQAAYDVLKGHGYVIERVLVTQEFAMSLLIKHQCRQRPLVPRKHAQYKRAFEGGRWRDIPGDIILTDQHIEDSENGYGCLINGKNRLTAIIDADQESFEHHYPHGVPLYLCRGVRSEDAGVLDIGAARSPLHTLAVDNRKGYSNSSITAALRFCMEFDESFTLSLDDPKRRWQGWGRVFDFSSDELSEASVAPEYEDLPKYDKVGQRVRKAAGIPRSAGAAAAFLIDRDNPNGGPFGSNQEFWDGVCFEATLGPKDPRAALYKYWRGIQQSRDKPDNIGRFAMAHVMRQYANWNLGVELVNSVVKEVQLMPPVWRKDYKWMNDELRLSKR